MRSRLSRTATSGMPTMTESARVARREHVDFDIDQVSIDAINGGAAGFEQRHGVQVLIPEYMSWRPASLKAPQLRRRISTRIADCGRPGRYSPRPSERSPCTRDRLRNGCGSG